MDTLHAEEVEMLIRSGTYITREALVMCVDSVEQRMPEDIELSKKIRKDTSFDIAVWTTDLLEVKLFKFEGQMRIQPRYPREAVVKTLEQLPYVHSLGETHEYWSKRFPSNIVLSNL